MKFPIIYLLRHGQTIWNVEGRYQGQLDSALTSKGEAQAQVNAKKLLNYLDPSQPFSFYASPLGRAKSTALITRNGNNTSRSVNTYQRLIFPHKRCQTIHTKSLLTFATPAQPLI